MTISLALVALGVVVGLGWIGTSAGEDLDRSTRIGFAYGIGLVWISAMMGLMAVIDLPLTPLIGSLFIGLPPVGWWIWRRGRTGAGWTIRSVWRRTMRSSRPPVPRDSWWWSAAVLVGLLCAIVVARTVVKPIQAWDAWSTYAMKAKIIYLDAAIPRSMFETVIAPNYPLGVPLQEVWMAWWIGSWDDVAIKLLFPGYLLAMLCLIYGELRDRFTARAAMWGTLFAASLPFLLQHGQDGYTDLPLAYFVLAGVVALRRYARDHQVSALALASVMAVGMVWTREDGVILVVINGALVLYDGLRTADARTRNTWIDLVRYLGPPGVIWGAWVLAKSWMAIPSNLVVSPALVIDMDRVGVAAEVLVTALFLEGNWMILWALVALALVDRDGEIASRDSRFFLWPVILYLGVIVALTATTALYQFLEGRTVLNRLILHVAPLAALWVAITYGRWWGWERMNAEGSSRSISVRADA